MLRRMQLLNRETHVIEAEGSIKQRQPWWLVSIWIAGGVLLDWRCAFEWFAARYSAHSEPVLRGTCWIAISCAIVALILTRLVRARLRDAASVFAVASLAVYRFLPLWWISHR